MRLTQSEAKLVREKAEKLAALRPPANWHDVLIRPFALAIAWPAAGELLLVTGIIVARRDPKIAAQTT